MSYFSHAFEKAFLGTHASQLAVATVSVAVDEGFVPGAGIRSIDLNDTAAPFALGLGSYGFFNPATNLSVDVSFVSADCCPLYLAGATIFQNDKIGQFHGGYTETNKSKLINPKYVTKFYRVDPCIPQNALVHVGLTPATAAGAVISLLFAPGTSTFVPAPGTVNIAVTGGTGTGMVVTVTVDGAGAATGAVILNPGINYTAGDILVIPGNNLDAGDTTVTVAVSLGTVGCCKEFLCDRNYNLRLDIKGSPALRFLTRNTYYTSNAYTGCCADPTIAPVPVDSTLVMILWATDFTTSPLINPFVQVIVWDQTGVPWFQTAALAVGAGYPATQTWDNYVSPGFIVGACAGLTFIGAYIGTQFGDCTFYPTDFYEKEPVRIYASEVDLNGDPCAFTGLCVVDECLPRQGQGFGESVLRDLILSESYRQNMFATNTDLRIREITQGYDLTNAINRNAIYFKYYIQHNVPRFNNPSGIFDNDQYLLEIISEAPSVSLEAFMATWLANCSQCTGLEIFDCTTVCTPIIPFT